METGKRIKEYIDACNNIIECFAERYDVNVTKDDWVAGDVGTTICVNEEFYLGMDEIILMLNKDVSWDEFLRYWDYNIDAHYLGFNTISLRSWVNGAPRLTTEQIEMLRKSRKEFWTTWTW